MFREYVFFHLNHFLSPGGFKSRVWYNTYAHIHTYTTTTTQHVRIVAVI